MNKWLALSSLLALLVPAVCSAHPVGLSFTQVTGPYLVDIGYIPALPHADTLFNLDFKLWQFPASTTPASFDDVFVTIQRKDTGAEILATTVKEGGATTLISTLPEAGPMVIEAQYEKNQQVIAEGKFDITVARNPDSYTGSTLWTGLMLCFGLLIGILGASMYFIIREENSTNQVSQIQRG